ncbi:iron ABC transporter permease [Marinobacter bryozoorum]|uniref:FecCD family ABC transporter permease n=1 Tax=Marinobacter bryozoorum TaxID=256324 RepID=UPI002005C72C|nr:iron ABC transporter permease [Marinobacter bryozoorum]MCK7545027.1 iron ABC transporter permease [Marinobacter bryozoorum]
MTDYACQRTPASRALVPPLPVAVFFVLAAALASLLWGAGPVGAVEALQVMTGQGSEEARFVVMELRLPRLATAMATGLALAIAGALLQALTRNPLAEPGLLGVSGGSAFAVTLAILLGASSATMTTLVAQAGALAGCALVMLATRSRGLAADPVRLVLAGATVTGLLLSLTSVMMLADQRAADEVRFWITGSIAGTSLADLVAVLPSMAVAGVLVVIVASPLAALSLGERAAMGLGHRPGRIRALVVVAVALLVGGATALAGPLVFAGLVVPFIARALAGPDIRKTLWLCLPIGPGMILVADTLARVIGAPAELPLGVITAMLGAPVLLIIVRSRRMPAL